MSFDDFKNWRSQIILLPDGGRIVCFYYSSESTSLTSIEDENHNIYRLNAQGEVVWQVRRDDSNHPPDWWGILHSIARANGHDGAREPFTEIHLEYADGSTSFDHQTYKWRNPCEWQPGCKIWLVGSAYQQYVLDAETGIAKNVTNLPVRPW